MLTITAQDFRQAATDTNLLYDKLMARVEAALAEALDATRAGIFPGYILVKAKTYETPSMLRRAVDELKSAGFAVSHAQSTLRIDTPRPN